MEASIVQKEREVVLKEVAGIKNGPALLEMALEICARCGTCAQVCPVDNGDPQSRYNPVLRTDRIRSLYHRQTSFSGKWLGSLVGAKNYQIGEIQEWAETFYECTGCRRCARYCPMGLDHSVVTRKARAIVNQLGLTPKRLRDVIDISLKTGNTDGATPEAFLDVVQFLHSEMKEETGLDIPIPVDKVGAEVFFVPPSGDVLVNPDAIMGIAKVFYVLGTDWTMSSHMFDGANYGLFTGDDAAMKADNLNYINEAKRLGCKVLMMGECGHA
ncbi:MAG TPA: (Fe-S)-binding protein, partial [bacterium]